MKQYTSKLLLFGEHSVIKGSQALAMPLPHFYGSWKNAKEDLKKVQMDLPAFANHLEYLQEKKELLCELDISRFKNELQKGLFFDSNIPTGYGVGSSGALCAAVYDSFCKSKLEKVESNFLSLKNIFAQLESFFHGSSSGTDPLICYVEKTLLLESKEKIRAVDFQRKDSYQLFLLDTKIPRQTGPFVNLFLGKCENPDYFNRLQSEYIPDVDEAITAFLSQNVNVLFEKIHTIGYFQFKYFQEMIPNDFRTIWLDGLASDFFKLKLCGAGGGGFLLGITFDFEKTKRTLKDYHLIKI